MNYTNKQPVFNNGQTVKNYNITQFAPGTKIGEGVTGLKFIRCNLVNCDIPNDATTDNCNTRQLNFCANLHPDWGLQAEPENCAHVTETIEVDNEVVGYIYEDEVI